MNGTKTCLLIVDDETDYRFILRYHFDRLGYDVLEAGDGEEALERFDEDPERIDLVITDIKMPRMGGDGLIKRLRSRNRLLPIIGITGHDDIKRKLNSFDEGAYYSVDKPLLDLHWPFVDRLVENAIRLYQRERQVESLNIKLHEREQQVKALQTTLHEREREMEALQATK